MQKLFSLFFKHFHIIVLVFVYLYFAKTFLVSGLLPIPSDTIVGLYHPFRDYFATDFPQGIPFKNFLITDPVRQIIPWKLLTIQSLGAGLLPLWNPYEMAGKPHLANFQSSVFYPFNFILFLKPFTMFWSLFIFLQPVLAGVFTYLFLRHLNLRRSASLLGSITFSFSAFSSVWFEWGNVVHTALWLPLILLAKEKLLKKLSMMWAIILIFAEVSQIFAGHLQIYLYSFIFSNVYLTTRIIQISYGEKKKEVASLSIKKYFPFLLIGIIVFAIASIQLIPTLQFVSLSARDVDLDWSKQGWFLPVNHLIQFIAPDFFGNPSTGNYWGIWNYAEVNGYIGLTGLLFALFSVITRRDKKTLFFSISTFVAFIFALNQPLARLPFDLSIPFVSTAQPTRLLFITSFSLSVLAALGFDYFLKNYTLHRRKITYAIISVLTFIGIILVSLWLYTVFGQKPQANVPFDVFEVAKSNLKLPTIIFTVMTVLLITFYLFYKKNKYLLYVLIGGMLFISIFDLLRFSFKFNSFTKQEYFFPSTKAIEFLQSQKGIFRIASVDSRILPPNFATFYKLQAIEGYDPLYLRSYAELVSAYKRGKADINPPFGFNRIVEFQDTDSSFYDMLNVKYILSFDDIINPKYKKVFQEGKTKIYENTLALPRAYFAKQVYNVNNQQEAAEIMFGKQFNPLSDAVVEGVLSTQSNQEWSEEKATIKEYTPNKVIIEIYTEKEGFLIISDSYYPTWKAKITDMSNSTELKIYKTNMNFRGVVVPKGRHQVEFYITLL